MTPSPSVPKTFCITGANAGVGFECARQLALRDGTERIILACRNREKATVAKESLETLILTGHHNHNNNNRPRSCVVEVLVLDVSNLASIRTAVDNLSVVVDCLILDM